MNFFNAALSIWGNSTRMWSSSNTGLQSFWDNVKTSENPLVIYNILESCLMCIDAAIQFELKKIIYIVYVKSNRKPYRKP